MNVYESIMQGLKEATDNMDDKIKREDVIFDPTEARVEKLIGKEVWAFDRYDGRGKRKSVLENTSASTLMPFECEDDAYTFIAEIMVEEKGRPYTTKEGESVMGRVVRSKNSKRLYMPVSYDQLYGRIRLMFDPPITISMSDLFENFEFADGSPCGVVE